MDKTQNCKDMWANTFFSTSFCMTDLNDRILKPITKLLYEDIGESAMAKTQRLFLRLGRNPASLPVPKTIYNLTQLEV